MSLKVSISVCYLIATLAIRARYAFAGLAAAALAIAVAGCRRSTTTTGAAAASARSFPSNVEVAESIYSGGLQNGWQDWGWTSKELVPNAPAKVRFDQYGGWILAKTGLKGDFGGLLFRVQEPPGGEFLEVHLITTSGNTLAKVMVEPGDRRDAGDGWTEVFVPIESLDPDGVPFDRVVLQAARPVGAMPVPVDKIALTEAPPKPSGPPVASGHATMVIDCRASATHVSSRIFGIAPLKDRASPSQLGATAARWGGNPTSTYNWRIGAYNSGSDWFFENGAAPAFTKILDDNAAQHLAVALTVPTIGWVSKDTKSVGFPASVLGPQEKTDPWRSEAGNGHDRGGKPIPTDPRRAYVAIAPAFVKEWVEAIRKEDAKHAGRRSVDTFILDNEPMLWPTTHRDVHPTPTSYEELLQRTIDYATVIRQADPEAIIAGPAEWGWTGYLYSAQDMANGGPALRPDRRAHGDLPVIAYYLKTLAEHEKSTGVRLLDVLDLHFYPQANGVYGDAADDETAAVRIRSTRALWDPTYVDESWIKEPVKLLPRMREWIDDNYPGRALSIGEWNFGGEKDMSGALAIDEALGRFAQFGVTYAYYWMAPPANSPGMWAFRAFRNYDGKGGHFLDWFTPTTVDHPDRQSIFASRDETGKRLVAIVLNFARHDAVAVNVDVTSCGKVAGVQTYTYDGGAAGIVAGPASGTAGTSIAQTLPAYSITVFDVQLAEGSPPTR